MVKGGEDSAFTPKHPHTLSGQALSNIPTASIASELLQVCMR